MERKFAQLASQLRLVERESGKTPNDMNLSKLRFGLLGCGWVARDYVAPAILEAPSASLVALCDTNQAAMDRVAQSTPGIATFTDLDEFLAQDFDAVYIATPNHLHLPLCEAAARAKKHVLCEKPMALTATDAQKMIEVCAQNGVRYATAFDQRFHAAHGRLRAMIDAGELGEITLARVHYACWTPRDWKPDSDSGNHENWRVDAQKAGGGAFIDLAPHGLDLTQMLLGSPLETVACLFQQRVFDYAVDDGAALIGKFENGALLTLNVAYNCPDNFPRRRLEIVGTKAMAILENTMGQTPGGVFTLVNAATGTRETVEIDPKLDISPFQNGIEAWSRALLDDAPFPFSPEADLHTMALLETAMRGQN